MFRFFFLLSFVMFVFINKAISQEDSNVSGADNLVEVEAYTETAGTVSVENQTDLLAPYRSRRSKHGITFSFGTEKFYPKNYLSFLDNATIDQILKSQPINLFAVDIGYKYNFNLGSLTFNYNYASGSGTGSFKNESRNIDFQRQTLSAGYYADSLFSEPWVVPYGSVGLSQFHISEEEYNSTGTLADDSAITDPILNYKVGVLFQLNWIESGIDSNTHVDGLRSSGLENTYLDLYFSWYQPTKETFDIKNPVGTADLDPDLRAEAQLGLGLKLEF